MTYNYDPTSIFFGRDKALDHIYDQNKEIINNQHVENSAKIRNQHEENMTRAQNQHYMEKLKENNKYDLERTNANYQYEINKIKASADASYLIQNMNQKNNIELEKVKGKIRCDEERLKGEMEILMGKFS